MCCAECTVIIVASMEWGQKLRKGRELWTEITHHHPPPNTNTRPPVRISASVSAGLCNIPIPFIKLNTIGKLQLGRDTKKTTSLIRKQKHTREQETWNWMEMRFTKKKKKKKHKPLLKRRENKKKKKRRRKKGREKKHSEERIRGKETVWKQLCGSEHTKLQSSAGSDCWRVDGFCVWLLNRLPIVCLNLGRAEMEVWATAAYRATPLAP